MSNGGLAFTNEGVLPKGEYEMTFEELRASILVQGPDNPGIPDWDTPWRAHLVNQTEILVKQLWNIGVTEIFLDGSFTEAKPHPNDIDGYFECDITLAASDTLRRSLNEQDPHKVWTWDDKDRKAYRGYFKKQLPMWHVYRVELWPHYGNLSGITDQFGNQLQFPAAFRKQRGTFIEKGIIKIIS